VKRFLIPLLLLSSQPLFAGKADVIDARASCTAVSCTFNVTVQHADAGWSHYANQWDVIAENGSVLGSRVLYHPHDHEQPFTRSLSGVKVPAGVKQVIIRARDSKHGWGGREFKLTLP